MHVLIFYMLKSRIYDTSTYKIKTLIHCQIFSKHGIQTLNVYEMLHSLNTKRCSFAVYEMPVYEMIVTRICVYVYIRMLTRATEFQLTD